MTEVSSRQADLLAAALGALEEGIAVLDAEAHVLVWNGAATAIAGHHAADLVGRKLPVNFYQLDAQHHAAQHHATHHHKTAQEAWAAAEGWERPMLVLLHHAQGHTLPAMLRRTPLRDEMGKRFGTLLRFHTVEQIDALPHGEIDPDGDHKNHIEQSQAGMEDRLDEAWQEWISQAIPFGLLWITVDQGAMLRKTHGIDASEAMLGIVERTLLHGLRPTEILGRWGNNEFLVLSHERTREMLMTHARHLAELTRTADFRWWGDRVPLSVSIGTAQAEHCASLSGTMRQAQISMNRSVTAGGNQVTAATHDEQ